MSRPHLPEDGSLGSELAEIKRRLVNLERSAPGAWGGDGTDAFLRSGNAKIIGSGKLQIIDASGNVLADFDATGVEIFESDGSVLVALTGSGIRLNDGAGARLIELTVGGLKAYTASGTLTAHLEGGRLRLWDSSGNFIFSSDEAFSAWVPSDDHTQLSTTSSTYVAVARFWSPIAVPTRCVIPVDVQASSDGTEGDIRLRQDTVAGNTMGEQLAVIGFGGSGEKFSLSIEGNFVTHDVDTWPVVTLQVRRSAGTGTIIAECARPGGFV